MVRLLACQLLLLAQSISGLRFPIVGDWGDNVASGIANQNKVAQALANWCDVNTCEFIISTGDNFYPQGVTSDSDPRFDSSWKDVYNQLSLIDKTWYQSIGNHDHDSSAGNSDGREWNQVKYGLKESRWVFPNLWHDFVRQDPAGFSVHFIVIDTQSLRWSLNNPSVQLQWLDDTLAASTAEWRVVIAHHPPYSAGNYGPGDSVIQRDVVPIVKKHKIQLFLSGHDHNLQHIRNATNVNDIDYVISGAGGRALYGYSSSAGNSLINQGFSIGFFGSSYGFTDFEFTADQVTFNHVDLNGKIIYTFTRSVSTR